MSRPVASVLAAALVVLAGCGGVATPETPASSPTPATSPSPSPPSAPAPPSAGPGTAAETAGPAPDATPDRLSADRAVAHARRLERTRTGATACGARFDRWVAGGYYVVADCRGAAPAVYRIDATGSRTVALDQPRPHRVYRGPAGTPTLDRARDVAVVALGDAPADLSVRVRYAGPVGDERPATVVPNATPPADGPTAVAAEVAAAPDDGVRLRRVVARPGRYRVVARTADGRVARATWTVDAGSRSDLAVYVDPSGRLTVRAVAL